MPDVREKMVELLSHVACNGNGESLGCCPDRKYGQCGEMADLSYCVIQNTANHLIANGVTIHRWIPVTERLPDRTMQCVCRYVVGDIEESPIYRVILYFPEEKTRHFQNEGSMGLRVTHWMPLPEPAKENE